MLDNVTRHDMEIVQAFSFGLAVNVLFLSFGVGKGYNLSRG